MQTPSTNSIVLELSQDVKELRRDVTMAITRQEDMKGDIDELKAWRAGLFGKALAVVTVSLIVGQILSSLVIALLKSP